MNVAQGVSVLQVVLIIVASVLGLALAVALLVFSTVTIFRAISTIARHIFTFIWGIISDSARLLGALLLSLVYIPLILGSIVIWRWSAANHYGNALTSELGSAALCLYRIIIAHPLRLIGLSGVTEGLDRRLPAVLAGTPITDAPARNPEHALYDAPTSESDNASHSLNSPGSHSPHTHTNPTKRGQFDGYTIIGSLAAGGSGAKLYIAEPDAITRASFQKRNLNVDQVVIKSFSLADGSSLPQIVRESRSLDAAKRLGLILDHSLAPDRFYYVMRYVPGENLSLITHQLHANSPPSSPSAPNGGLGDPQLSTAIRYMCDLVSTLSTYHRGGLWHKDVKPDNIIIATRTDRRAHLVDFGLVSSLRSAMTLTTHGTEYFRDPEMVRRALKGVKVHEVDGTKFDIFAAGAVFYSMIEESFPAHGVLSQITKRCPEAIKWVIRRAMTEYDKRYISADAMLADLEFIAAAKDPFTIRPIDLPSMKEGAFAPNASQDNSEQDNFAQVHAAYAAAEASVAQASVAQAAYQPPSPSTPIPTRPLPNPLQTRRIPLINIRNWWTGESSVIGHDEKTYRAAPFMPAHVGQNVAASTKAASQAVSYAAAQAAAAVASVARGGSPTPPPVPTPTPVTPPTPPAPPAPPSGRRPLVDRADRKPARTQLDNARKRIADARARAHSRLKANSPRARSTYNNGAKGGVAIALFIFLGAAIGVGALMITSNIESPAPVEGENYIAVFDSGRPATDESAAFETPDSPLPPIAPLAPIPPVPPVSPTTQASLKSPVAPTPTIGRALFINDCKRPWSTIETEQIDRLGESLSSSGFKLIGESPLKSYEPTDAEISLAASLRIHIGAITADSGQFQVRIASWIATQPDLAAVIWVSPAPQATPTDSNTKTPPSPLYPRTTIITNTKSSTFNPDSLSEALDRVKSKMNRVY